MLEIKSYKLLSAESLSDLEKQVQAHIDSGWQPYGFPVADGKNVIQAVVHYINSENITDI